MELEFTVKSADTALLYYEDTTSTKAKIAGYFLLGTSLFALLLLFLGSFYHKMAAVELLHVLQFIYFLQFTLNNYTPNLESFQWLSIVGLCDLFLQ